MDLRELPRDVAVPPVVDPAVLHDFVDAMSFFATETKSDAAKFLSRSRQDLAISTLPAMLGERSPSQKAIPHSSALSRVFYYFSQGRYQLVMTAETGLDNQ